MNRLNANNINIAEEINTVYLMVKDAVQKYILFIILSCISVTIAVNGKKAFLSGIDDKTVYIFISTILNLIPYFFIFLFITVTFATIWYLYTTIKGISGYIVRVCNADS